jgi:hypothetical protein
MEVHKGPKITSSHSFNHIKNDEVTGISNTIPVNNEVASKRQTKVINESQFQKSAYPAQPPEDEELRSTFWKRGPPKITSSKLPPAFSNPVAQKG